MRKWHRATARAKAWQSPHLDGPVTNVLAARLTVALLVALASACATIPQPGSASSEPRPAALAASAISQRKVPPLPVDAVGDADYVVRVVAGDVTCSGTLIQEDQVLTAHHCVADRSRLGEVMRSNVHPNWIRVELGGDYLPWGEVGVREVVAPPCGYSAGDGDIAILVLERRLVGVATLVPRLGRAPQLGETVEPVGFGRCPLSADGIRRRARIGGAVDTVKAGRFRLSASICPGDSGGPGISQTGELVGVISASAMDGSERTVGQSEFTRVDRWRSVFANAELVADGIPPTEIPPLACSER